MTRKPGWYWCWDPDIGWVPKEWLEREVFQNWNGPGLHMISEPRWHYYHEEEPWVLEENVGPHIPYPHMTTKDNA